jgi:hypothetical protein
MPKKEDGLVVAPPTGLTKKEQLPDYIPVGDQSGMEDVSQQDVAMPRVGLCQSGSPERKRNEAKYIEGLEEGNFFNTTTKEIYGDRIRVIPIRFFKQKIKFFALDDGGGIDCQSLNGIDGGHYSATCATCPHSKFIDGEHPSCFEIHNRVCLILPSGDVAAVSMKSTAIPVSKQWSAIAKMRNAPLFSAIYELKATPAVRGGNSFYTYTQRMVQSCSADDFKYARQLYESISSKTIIVDQESPVVEADTSFDAPAM